MWLKWLPTNHICYWKGSKYTWEVAPPVQSYKLGHPEVLHSACDLKWLSINHIAPLVAAWSLTIVKAKACLIKSHHVSPSLASRSHQVPLGFTLFQCHQCKSTLALSEGDSNLAMLTQSLAFRRLIQHKPKIYSWKTVPMQICLFSSVLISFSLVGTNWSAFSCNNCQVGSQKYVCISHFVLSYGKWDSRLL